MNIEHSALPTFTIMADKHLLHRHGSSRYLVCSIQAPKKLEKQGEARPPLSVALVIDRSGSMSGNKIEMAKSAALAVIDQLSEQDRVAVVIFDDKIDVLQIGTFATKDVRARLHSIINEISARNSTALHEGWLRGCDAIAPEKAGTGGLLARCFLLTDGLANIGETNIDVISTDALRIRRDAFIGTSTFGIGSDYDEQLLMSMAIAGGGQFYHLRTTDDFVPAFTGELGDLFSTILFHTSLEIVAPDCSEFDGIGAYRFEKSEHGVYHIDLGDVPYNALREIACRLSFPQQTTTERCPVQMRLSWNDSDGNRQTIQETMTFRYADESAIQEEPLNTSIIHLVGREHLERTRRSSYMLNKHGKFADASTEIEKTIADLTPYGDDPEIHNLLSELKHLQADVSAPMNPMAMKEQYYQSQRFSRRQAEHRPDDK